MQKGDRIRPAGKRHKNRIATFEQTMLLNGLGHFFDNLAHVGKISMGDGLVNL